jgi:hypothetical protein
VAAKIFEDLLQLIAQLRKHNGGSSSPLLDVSLGGEAAFV